MIWRDDDIPSRAGKDPNLERLLAVDDVFQRYGVVHTVAVIGEWLTPELGRIIRERGMSAQVHCWRHDDLSSSLDVDALRSAVHRIEDMVGVRPTVLYPPWNRADARLRDAARELDLEVSTRKVSLDQYIRTGGDVSEDVVNFHSWYLPDALLISAALQIATSEDH